MSNGAAVQKKKRKDFIPYFLGFVIFLYCTVHLVSFTAQSTQERRSVRVRRALGEFGLVTFHLPIMNEDSFVLYFESVKCEKYITAHFLASQSVYNQLWLSNCDSVYFTNAGVLYWREAACN